MDARRFFLGASAAVLVWLAVPASASASSNVTISTNPDTAPPPVNCTFTPTANDFNINVVSLQTCLGLMPTTVTTSGAGNQAGTITIASSVTWAASNTLTLSADDAVSQTSGATVTAGGPVFVTTGAAPITLTQANNFGTVSLNNSGVHDAFVTDANAL